jgi:hypothetical protein
MGGRNPTHDRERVGNPTHDREPMTVKAISHGSKLIHMDP